MRKCRIGVLFGLTRPFHYNLLQSIRLTVGRHPDFTVAPINVEDVESRITPEMIHHIVSSSISRSGPYDVLVAIGQRASDGLIRVAAAVGNPPLVFLGIKDPSTLNCIQSFEAPGNNATAVVCEPHRATLVAEKLLLLQSCINRIIIPYWPESLAGALPGQVAEISRLFENHGAPVLSFSVQTKEELFDVVERNTQSRDVVLLLEGNVAGDVVERLSYLCSKRDALLCADSLEAMRLGAACALGGSLDPFAHGLMRVLFDFHYGNTSMGFIPVVRLPNNRQFVLNLAMYRMVGFPEEALDVLRKADGVMLVKEWVNNPFGGNHVF